MKIIARLAVLLVFALAPPALAEKRVALVIGNAAYKHAPALANPRNDAEAVAAALKRLKFEVIFGTDLDKPGMERLLRRFSDAVENADVAVAFYAGHGLQVHGRNYLVPVDARLEKENDLRFDAVPLDDVQSLMETSQRINILILDACRDNPLARNLARAMGTRSTSIGRGLGETKAGIGTLIVYATQPGNVALDGDDKNSPFTTALLKYMEAPGLEIRQVLTRVRNDVITTTRDRQVPWDSSSLRGDFFFVSAAPQPAAPQPTPPPQAGDEVAFWQGIRDSRSAGDFKAYLERWPNGLFAALARARIAEIERAAAEESRRAEEQRKKAEEQRADAERKARDDAEKKVREDAERKSRDDARQDAERKRGHADALARIAAQRLDRAKAALRQNQYLDARRLAEESAALAKEAGEASPASSAAQSVARDLAAFRRELDTRIEQRTATLVREARGFIAAKKFADAEKRLAEAEGLSPASATTARRELEAAQGRAGADAQRKAEDDAKKKADADAKKKAEDEAKKKAEEAKSATTDPKKQAQTANSWYAPERKRGLIAFGHKKATLEPGAIAALETLATSLQGQKDYKITLVAGADRSEGAAAELQSLSRARLTAIQQWLVQQGKSGTNLRSGIGPARGEGPEYRVVSMATEIVALEKKEEKPPTSTPPSGATAAELTRRITGTQWGGTLSVSALNLKQIARDYSTIIKFKAGGVFDLVASSIFNPHVSVPGDDKGTWSATDGRVCISLERTTAGQQQCYAASIDEEGRVTLSGPGLLGGKRFSK
jgi:uncharacterized caspase-like protein